MRRRTCYSVLLAALLAFAWVSPLVAQEMEAVQSIAPGSVPTVGTACFNWPGIVIDHDDGDQYVCSGLNWAKRPPWFFQPSTDAVVVTINPVNSLGLSDLLQMFDVDGNEALSVTAAGNTDLGNPPASDARLNIQGGGTFVDPVAPDVIGTPYLWFRADDVTGCVSGSTCTATTACEFRDFGSAPDNCYGVAGSGEGIWRNNSLNGHDTIERTGLNPKLFLTLTPNADYSMTGAFTAVFVYDPTTTLSASEIGSGEWDQAGQDAQLTIPGVSDSSTSLVSDTTSTDRQLSSPDNCDGTSPTCDSDPRIFIFRRTGAVGTVDGYGTSDITGQPMSYGSTATAGLGTVILQSLLTRNTDVPAGYAAANFRLAEYILYNSTAITDTQRDQLYQYLAQKYSIDQIPASAGSTTGLVAGYEPDDTRVFRVDNSGRVMSGDTDIVSAGARLHVRDASTAQVRLENTSANFCTETVNSSGDLAISCSGGNVTIEGVDLTTLDDPQYLVSVAANPPLANADVVTAGTGIAYTNGTNAGTFAFRYADTQAANPTFNAKECVFTTSGTNGGAILCEGSVANGNELLYQFSVTDFTDANGAFFFTANDSEITDADGPGLVVSGPSLAVAAGNAITVNANDVAVTLNAIDDAEVADDSLTAGSLAADSVSASELNATGVETELEAVMELAEMQPPASADNQTPISTAANTAAWSTIPLCDATTEKTNFDGSTWVCNTDDAGVAAGEDAIRVEDGDNAGTFTAMDDMDMDDGGDIDFQRTAGPPDIVRGEIRPDSVGAPEIAAGAVGTSEAANLDAGDVTSGVFADALVDGSAEANEVVGAETDESLCSWESGTGLIECDLAVNAGTDLTTDLEEEVHCADHDTATSGFDCSSDQFVPDFTEIPGGTFGAGNFTSWVYSGAGAIDITHDFQTSNTMKVQQSDPGAAGPILWLQQISASPAANDIVGEMDFVGRDTGPADQTYATIKGQIDVATGGGASETGTLKLGVVTSGTIADEVSLNGTSFSPTTNDGNVLGTTSLRWGDLFIATGGVLNLGASDDCTVTHASGVITFAGSCAWDYGGTNELLEIPNGTAPDVTGATGRIALDTTDSGQSGTQLIVRDDGGDKIYPDVQVEKTWVEDIISTDDTIGVLLPPYAATVVAVGCVCDNTSPVSWSTLPDIILEDGDGNDMTGTATCVIRTSDATFAAVTDNSASQLGVGEAAYAFVNNTPVSSPAGTGDCTISVVYRVTRR